MTRPRSPVQITALGTIALPHTQERHVRQPSQACAGTWKIHRARPRPPFRPRSVQPSFCVGYAPQKLLFRSLALASLDRTCRDHIDVSATFSTIAQISFSHNQDPFLPLGAVRCGSQPKTRDRARNKGLQRDVDQSMDGSKLNHHLRRPFCVTLSAPAVDEETSAGAVPALAPGKAPPLPKAGPFAQPRSHDQVGFPAELTKSVIPPDSPLGPAIVSLGEKLFFDSRLSDEHGFLCNVPRSEARLH